MTEVTENQLDVEEVLISELDQPDAEGMRTLRIYDQARGDFELEIPANSKVTFGYFNPASAGMQSPDIYAGGRGGNTMKTTALRIYERGEKSNQLACFLGVDGFRDKTLTITRLRQRVVIESNFEDDGKGNENFKRDVTRQLERAQEDDELVF